MSLAARYVADVLIPARVGAWQARGGGSERPVTHRSRVSEGRG